MALDMNIFCISIMPFSSPNPMFDHLLEYFHETVLVWSNIGFCDEVTQAVSIEIDITYLIWSYKNEYIYSLVYLSIAFNMFVFLRHSPYYKLIHLCPNYILTHLNILTSSP